MRLVTRLSCRVLLEDEKGKEDTRYPRPSLPENDLLMSSSWRAWNDRSVKWDLFQFFERGNDTNDYCGAFRARVGRMAVVRLNDQVPGIRGGERNIMVQEHGGGLPKEGQRQKAE
jgi:hypothetical protein